MFCFGFESCVGVGGGRFGVVSESVLSAFASDAWSTRSVILILANVCAMKSLETRWKEYMSRSVKGSKHKMQLGLVLFVASR